MQAYLRSTNSGPTASSQMLKTHPPKGGFYGTSIAKFHQLPPHSRIPVAHPFRRAWRRLVPGRVTKGRPGVGQNGAPRTRRGGRFCFSLLPAPLRGRPWRGSPRGTVRDWMGQVLALPPWRKPSLAAIDTHPVGHRRHGGLKMPDARRQAGQSRGAAGWIWMGAEEFGWPWSAVLDHLLP